MSFTRVLDKAGAAGALIAGRDWSQHALGPIEGWPVPLTNALSICLCSKTPMIVWWGHELIEFYNDAYRPVLGTHKHPRAMGARGEEIWPEIWHIMHPIFSSVLDGGPPVDHKEMFMLLDRNGFDEETYFDHAHCALYADDGRAAGVLTTVTETTQKVLGERRLSTLKTLAEQGARARSEERAYADAAAILAANGADAPYCMIYHRDGDAFHLASSAGALPDTQPLDLPLAEVLNSGELRVTDIEQPTARLSARCDAQDRNRPRRTCLLPVRLPTATDPCGVLVVGLSPHLRFDDAYRDYLTLAVSQLGATLSSARSHEHHAEHVRELEERERENLRRELQTLAKERDCLLQQERQARAAAEAANRVKDDFLAVLGHELRNPLAPITTALALMRQRGPLDSEALIIERQVGHLTRLVEDLLDVSRIERGKVELKRLPLNLSKVVREAVELASPLLEEREQHLDLDVPTTGLDVLGDRTRIAQVLANLLTNAAKYSDRGRLIRIRGRLLNETAQVEICVRDQGIGIEPGMLQAVWNAFTQGAQAIDRSHGGLGLGLTIVRNLVSMHGGSVAAYSEGKGKGSEFCVRLPALQAEPRHTPEPAARPSQRPSTSFAGRKLLLVDDNEDAVELLAEWFRARGADVETASDGVAALEAAKRFEPEVALLDLGLPALSGYEVARTLRSQRLHRDMLLVAVTGYGEQSARQQTLDAGFDEHWVKPLDLHRFEPVLRERLAARDAATRQR